MWIFLVAGIVYLIGIGIILYIRPSFMFAPDGSWKEFGIGKSADKHTPFPFWLFCLTWAVISYTSVIFVSWILGPRNTYASMNNVNSRNTSMEVQPLPTGSRRNRNIDPEDFNGNADLPRGYYILNKKASKQLGKPKYVYFGPIEPQELENLQEPLELEKI
jgi:hypothetical protein